MKSRLLTAVLISAAASAQPPQFSKDGKLTRPENFREWIFLTSGLGMTYGGAGAGAPAEHPRFDNVFVSPAAHQEFMATGAWPDKTVLVLEIRASGSKSSINTAGHFQNEIIAIEVAVKDVSRFPGGWAYFNFGKSADPVAALPRTASCYECHSKNGAVENTFVQFYPTLLPVATARGTLKK